MNETVCITATSTSLNADVELVTLLPWPIQTLVVGTCESSSDFAESPAVELPYDIPKEVEVRSWLADTKRVLDFWDNDEDAVYDSY